MLSFCLKCQKNAESKNLKIVKTKIGRIMLPSNGQCLMGKGENLSKVNFRSD